MITFTEYARMRFIPVVIAFAIALSGCSWFEKKDTNDSSASERQEFVTAAVNRLRDAMSYHYDATAESTLRLEKHPEDPGRIFVRITGDKTGSPLARKHAQDGRIEFNLQTGTGEKPIAGDISFERITLPESTFLKLVKLTLAQPEQQAAFNMFLEPYLGHWIETTGSSTADLTPFSAADLGYNTGNLSDTYNNLTDRSDLSPEQLKALDELTRDTNFLLVTGSSESFDSPGDRIVTVTFNETGFVEYMKRSAEIKGIPLTTEQEAELTGFIAALDTYGTITISTESGIPKSLTVNGTFDTAQLKALADTDEQLEDVRMLFDADIEFSDVGKTFTISAPKNSEPLEAILDSIFAVPLDLEGDFPEMEDIRANRTEPSTSSYADQTI